MWVAERAIHSNTSLERIRTDGSSSSKGPSGGHNFRVVAIKYKEKRTSAACYANSRRRVISKGIYTISKWQSVQLHTLPHVSGTQHVPIAAAHIQQKVSHKTQEMVRYWKVQKVLLTNSFCSWVLVCLSLVLKVPLTHRNSFPAGSSTVMPRNSWN